METSKRWKFNKQDLKKIAIGAGVALAGAVLTYMSEVMVQVDFGDWTPIVVALWSVIANAGRKWISENGTSY